MPYTEVMPKFKKGELHSGSDKGPTVTNRKQAIAIMLSEKKEAEKGKKEYQPKKYQEGGPVEADLTDDRKSSVTNYSDEAIGSTYKKGGAVKATWRRW